MKRPLHSWHSARLWDTETNKAQRLPRGYGLERSYHKVITGWDTLQAQDVGRDYEEAQSLLMRRAKSDTEVFTCSNLVTPGFLREPPVPM